MTTPLTQHYAALVASGGLAADAAQAGLVAQLADLAAALQRFHRNVFTRCFGTPPPGLYIYGAVGRGKSRLMDLFFAAVPKLAKRRVHFHAFMLEVQQQLHEASQGTGSKSAAIDQVAARIAASAQLLCFDEFQVHTIADAMILARLFTALFRRKVVVVATSNTAPDGLYAGGLQRPLFEPFIALLKSKLTVVGLGGGQDYRQARLAGSPVYFTPLDAAAAQALSTLFARLSEGAAANTLRLPLSTGRTLTVPRGAGGVAWFSFAELCQTPLAAADYLALSQHFHTLIISAVPWLGADMGDATLRFIHVVDVWYEQKRRLILSTATPLPQLCAAENPMTPRFARTLSRLAEMQAKDYGVGG